MITKNKLLLILLVLGPAILLAALIATAMPHRMGRTKSEILFIYASVNQYRKTYRVLPSGDSQAVIRTLMGANDRNRVFLESTHTNSTGEPLDNWGTPYQIEMLDAKNFQIRSAGPNNQPGDADDVVFDADKLIFIEK